MNCATPLLLLRFWPQPMVFFLGLDQLPLEQGGGLDRGSPHEQRMNLRCVREHTPTIGWLPPDQEQAGRANAAAARPAGLRWAENEQLPGTRDGSGGHRSYGSCARGAGAHDISGAMPLC